MTQHVLQSMLCSSFDQVCVFSGCSPSERLISRVGGQARSKTPNAEMERSVYGADCTSTPTYLSKVTPTFITVFVTESLDMFKSHLLDPFHSIWHFHPPQQTMLRDLCFGVEPDDGENLRRIGRSLSGTVVTSRRSRLTATRSFVSVPSCALLPPCGCAIKLHLANAALYTLLLPVLFSPAVCLVSAFCPAFRFPTCPPTLCFSSLSFRCFSQRWSRLMSVPLLAYFLSSESCCYSTTIITPILLITNTFSSPPPSTAPQVNTALSSNDATRIVFRGK